MDGSADAKVLKNVFTVLLTIEGEDWDDDESVNERVHGGESHQAPSA